MKPDGLVPTEMLVILPYPEPTEYNLITVNIQYLKSIHLHCFISFKVTAGAWRRRYFQIFTPHL
jgi:hypothetical protein